MFTPARHLFVALVMVAICHGPTVAQNRRVPVQEQPIGGLEGVEVEQAGTGLPSITPRKSSLSEESVIGAGSIVEAIPPPAAVPCHPVCVVREKVAISARRKYRCYGPPLEQTLCVENPAECQDCLYAVPVCVPACCTEPPVCCDRRVGLLGRGYVTYRWACGFEVRIVFRVHGGVLLRYC